MGLLLLDSGQTSGAVVSLAASGVSGSRAAAALSAVRGCAATGGGGSTSGAALGALRGLAARGVAGGASRFSPTGGAVVSLSASGVAAGSDSARLGSIRTLSTRAALFMTTAQDLIDAARIRHWSFTDVALGDGAAVLFLNQRQRTLLLKYGQTVEPLAGTSVNLATSVSGALVALQNGVPTYANSYQDGWTVHLDGNGVPYVDFTEAPQAGDPFGQNGGTPGFPLPVDFIKLTACFLVYEAGLQGPCRIVEERERMQEVQRLGPAAFVSGNRLVPVRPLASGNSNDAWSTVQTVQLSYLAMPVIQALSDPVAWPAVLSDALIASLADLFAMSSKQCPQADKVRFAKEAAGAAEAIGEAGIDILGSLTQQSVLFKG